MYESSERASLHIYANAAHRFDKLRGGSRISGKWVQIYKDLGFALLDFISFFSESPSFILIGYLKTGGGGGGSSDPPEPPLDLPLMF